MQSTFFSPNLNLAELLNKNIYKTSKELRFASYNCISGIITHSWGCQLMLNQKGFLNFVKSRDLSENINEKEWKFTIQTTLESFQKEVK